MAKTIAYWVFTALLALGYLTGGVVDILQPADFLKEVGKLGYPLYFFVMLGCWKIAGALVVLAPGLRRAKEWAYAGMVFNLTSAGVAHVMINDSIGDTIPSQILLVFVLASWALRPENRKLPGGWV